MAIVGNTPRGAFRCSCNWYETTWAYGIENWLAPEWKTSSDAGDVSRVPAAPAFTACNEPVK
jgi:hypothetical protein